jgi:hypothetical protein
MNRRCALFTAFVFLSWGFVFGTQEKAGATKPLGSTFSVSTTGDDSNSGTEKAPWRTIQHAANVATPGSTVFVHGGIYVERVVINVSGDATQGYVTFQSLPGETAILDGETLPMPEGRTALVTIQDKNYIRIQGFEIRNYRTSERRCAPAGIFVQGSGSSIEILKNNVHHIEQNYQKKGANAFGIAVYGTSAQTPITKLVIDGNEVHHLKTGSSESLVVNGNVTDFRITHNVVHDNNNIGIDVIGYERTAPDPDVDRARNGVVSHNLVYSITSRGNPSYGDEQNSDGIYVDGGTQTLIEQNVIYDVDFGIELASEHKGRTTSYITARNNLIYSCHTAGVSIGGYDAERGITEHCTIVNNTLYRNDTSNTGAGEFQMQYYAADNIFKNNILLAGRQGLLTVSKSAPMPGGTPAVVMDYNLYFSPLGPEASQWQFDNARHTGFSNYIKATGNDQHSRFADPLFVNPSANNFHLQRGSPAINMGVLLEAAVLGLQDLDGVPRNKDGRPDIGCYERQ